MNHGSHDQYYFVVGCKFYDGLDPTVEHRLDSDCTVHYRYASLVACVPVRDSGIDLKGCRRVLEGVK